MKTRPTLKASLTTGTMLLSGVFLFAQAASTVAPATPTAPATRIAPSDMTTQSAKVPVKAPATTANHATDQKKHLAGVKYSDRTAAETGTLDTKQASDKQ